MIPLPPVVTTVLLVSASNVFMTIAWYGHLKHLNTAPWWIAALVSWGIALFEYLLHFQELEPEQGVRPKD